MDKPTIILVNDTDHLDCSSACAIFGMLNAWDIPFTHATFYTLESEDEYPNHPNSLARHCFKNETASLTDLNKEKYISLLNHQIQLGNEIAYHGYSQISNTRDKFLKGVSEIYKTLIKPMVTYIEHGGTPYFHPIEGCKKETLEVSGSNKDSEYYVEDLIRANFNQSWCYFDLVNPLNNMNIDDLEKSLIEDTFYSNENLNFMKRYRAKDVVSLIESGKTKNKNVLIAYTHFGYKGYPQGTPLESWNTFQDIQKNCQYLSSLREKGFKLSTIRSYLEN